MNRLRKKAWRELVSALIMTILSISAYIYLAIVDHYGFQMLIQGLIFGGIPGGTLAYRIVKKKNNKHQQNYDERELFIIKQAYEWFFLTLISYLFLFVFITFCIIGGKGMVPTWTLPVILFSGLFFSQCVHSVILLHNAKESNG